MLTEVLNAPVAELTMGNEVNIRDDFLDGGTLELSARTTSTQLHLTYFLLFHTVLEDVLNDKTTSLAKSNLVPHASKRLVDLDHNLRWLSRPSQLKQLLPDMTSIAVNDSVRNATEELANHVSLVVLRHRIEGFLNDVTPERIHAESNDVAMNGISNSDNLLRSTMLEAALDQEVAETIDHQGVGLVDDRLDNLELLFSGTDLELLLQEDRRLLVIVAHDFVNDVFPITRHGLVEESTVVEWFERRDIGLAVGIRLQLVSLDSEGDQVTYWQRPSI